jgi:hypothetical protein
MIVSYELLGRFEEAAQAAMGHNCFGVPIDGQALLAAWRAGGASGYWQERLAALDRVSPALAPMVHYNYACVLTQLGRADDAMTHLGGLLEQKQGSVVFLAVEPALVPLRARPDFQALLNRIGVPHSPRASERSTAST